MDTREFILHNCKTIGFILLICAAGLYAGGQKRKEFFVSPAGSDKNNGGINFPFASIERARDAVRDERKQFGEAQYTIYLRGGIYHLTKTIEFDKRDNFTDDSPLVFIPYNGERVRISGGISVPRQRVGKVSDSAALNRFITRVKNNILQIDYSGLNIDEGKITPYGFGRPYSIAQMELFGKQNAYFPARWPNKGYARIKKVIEKGSVISAGDTSCNGAVFEYEAERAGRWENSEEPWIAGYFCYGFADEALPVKKTDPENRQITAAAPSYYGFSAGESFNGFYGFNILEDIDIPGEYFTDKKNKKIYFYPFDDEDFSDLSLSVISEPLISLTNSANVHFYNLTFECSRGMGIYIEGGNDNRFSSCVFKNIGSAAIVIGRGVDEKGIPASAKLGNFKAFLYENQTWDRNCGKNHLIENCEIYNTGAGGIILGGGNRLTLDRGNNRVSNCSIHDFNRREKTYRGGINVDGVGNVIEHNEIYNCPGTAIHLNGNEHLIQYNIIHDAVTDGHDMGALYYGRNPSERGNVARYNYFHHNGNGDGTIMSVYHDDGACGMTVYGNVFYKPGSVAVMIGGGSDIVYKNNVFVDVPLAFHIDNRLQNWGKEEFILHDGVYNKRLRETRIDSLPYSDFYPELAAYWSDSSGLPERNVVENNIFCNAGQLHNGSAEWINFRNNYITSSDPGFESLAKMNFKLRDDSPVFSSLPDFENIPFEIMGRRNLTSSPKQCAETQTLFVHSQVLTEDFKGVNGVYHGFAFMPEQIEKGMNDKDREREFSRVKDMRLKIARTWYRPDWACGASLYNDFNWQSDKMLAFYKWLDEMKKLNVEVALQAGWWFTRDTYFNKSEVNNSVLPNPAKDPGRYAEWVCESLRRLIVEKKYTNIKYLVLFTEPLNYNSGAVPVGFTQPEYYEKVCKKINAELIKAGLREKIKIVGPNSGSARAGEWVGWAKDKLDGVIDIYSWHAYNATRWDREYGGWREIVERGKAKMASTGKPFWIDEYGCGYPDESVRAKPDYGNYIAQCNAAFIKSGAQASLIWLLMDQQYVWPVDKADGNDSFHNGVHRWGLLKWPHDSIENAGEPYPAYYAFSLMSRYLGGGGGTTVLKSTNADSLYIVVTRPGGKELTIMIINAAHYRQNFEVLFDEQTNATLKRHLYDPAAANVSKDAGIITADKEVKVIRRSFSDELPPRGVAFYTTID
jgi:hypothetical protein